MEAEQLKQLVKDSLREVLREERLKLCQVLIPYVSDKEMQEIQAKLGSSEYATGRVPCPGNLCPFI